MTGRRGAVGTGRGGGRRASVHVGATLRARAAQHTSGCQHRGEMRYICKT